jgi:hypothetical protein
LSVRTRFVVIIPVVLAFSACKKSQPQDSVDAAASGQANEEPVLFSKYATTFGDLGWQERRYNTITFTDPGQTVFLRCTLYNSPEVPCSWSKEIPGVPGEWDRGRAQLRVRPDRVLVGTWGHGDSDSDGGPFEMKPLRDEE